MGYRSIHIHDVQSGCELIRKDKDRLHLRGLLLAGVASAPAAVADEAYFRSLRDRVGQAGLSAKRN